MKTIDLLDSSGALLGRFELLWPGTGLRTEGAHRILVGGVLTAQGPLLVLPELRAARDCSEGLLLAWRAGPRLLELGLWTGQELRPLGQVQASGVELGWPWLSWWRGAQAGLLTLPELAPLRVPLGARGGVPSSHGPGLLWADGRVIFRLDHAQATPRVAAVLDQGVRSLRVGPGNAAVAWTRSAAWSLVPGRPARRLALDAPGGSVVFSRNGRVAMVEDAHGVARVDLAAGAVEDYREAGQPAGLRHWLDLAGALHPWSDQSDGEALLPGPGVRLGDRLHGPGGRAWSLVTGRPTGPALSDGAELAAALGDSLLVAEGEQLYLRAAGGGEEELLHFGDELPLALWSEAGRAWLETDEGCYSGTASPDSWGPLDQAQAPVLPDSPPLPEAMASTGLPLDGWLISPDGCAWGWQDDGLLLRSPG